jgi:hypothetical protein
VGGNLVLGIVAAVVIVGAVFAIPFIRVRLELGRLRDRYDLSDEEVEAYLREFPEICHAVETSLGDRTPSSEVKRIARESAISAILRQRSRRTPEPPQVEVAVEAEPVEPARRELTLHGSSGEITIEDLRPSSNGSSSSE